LRDVLVYGLASGLLVTLLELTEYRFLILEHSLALYGGLVAVFFAGVGIWLGRSLAQRGPLPAPVAAAPFAIDDAQRDALGITPRELEILGLIAAGLSNRDIAERLFVSESTVKTHTSRLFDKLGAQRRTQAVQIGKAARLIP
jgi:DNA-binding CsgD family transcriptional regulator